MPEPRGWELFLPYYLKIAEEELRRLSPFKELSLRSGEGPLLLFGKIPMTLRCETRPALSEAKKWFPVLQEWARNLVENLVLRTAYNGLPGPKVLSFILRQRPISGLVFTGKIKSFPPGTLALEEKLYFLPAIFQKTTDFLREAWRSGWKFVSAQVDCRDPEDHSQFRKSLAWAKLFGFSYLSRRAKESLQPFWEREEDLRRILRSSGSLVLVKLGAPPRGIKTVKVGEQYLFRTRRSPRALLGTSQGLCGGIYEGKASGAPLALVYGAYEQARRLGGGLVKFEPFTYHVLGDLYADWGDLGQALWAYRQAEGHTPQPAHLYNSLGLVFRALELTEEAIGALKKALHHAPQDALVHFNLGSLLVEKGDLAGISHLRKAWELFPSNPLFTEKLAEALWNQGEAEEALKILSGARQLSLKGQTLLGRLLYQQGRIEEAFEILREVVHSREAPAEALAFLALIYRRRGEPEAAEVLAREARRRGVDIPDEA